MRRWIIRLIDSELTRALLVFQKEIYERIDSVTTSEGTSDLLERQEALERRMERVHQECLKFLQAASQRESRAKRMLEEAGIESDESTPMTLPAVNQDQDEQAHVDDLTWVSRQIEQQA